MRTVLQGALPPNPLQGFCPLTPLGALPQTSVTTAPATSGSVPVHIWPITHLFIWTVQSTCCVLDRATVGNANEHWLLVGITLTDCSADVTTNTSPCASRCYPDVYNHQLSTTVVIQISRKSYMIVPLKCLHIQYQFDWQTYSGYRTWTQVTDFHVAKVYLYRFWSVQCCWISSFIQEKIVVMNSVQNKQSFSKTTAIWRFCC